VAPFVYVNFAAHEKGKLISDKSHYLKLTSADKEKYKAKVLAWSEAKDLALLKLNYVAERAEPLPLAKDGGQPGQAVHSIGNPGGSGALWVYTSGTVRTAAYQKQWKSLGAGGLMSHDALIIETQSPTNPGDSGGPLVNDSAELVGVTQGNNLEGNAISLFVDVGEIRGFLQSHGCRWLEKGSGR
jgi:serine protease Do